MVQVQKVQVLVLVSNPEVGGVGLKEASQSVERLCGPMVDLRLLACGFQPHTGQSEALDNDHQKSQGAYIDKREPGSTSPGLGPVR